MVDTKHVHMIGICGSGLSAIALVLLESGYQVSGSDRQEAPIAQRLVEAGAQVFIGHQTKNIAGADVVVRSSAITDQNVEVQAAHASGIPVYKRVDFLGQLTSGKKCIAVAGTHGKTTTTAMIAWMLTALEKDPSYIVGGISANLGRNAHAGKGTFFVIEADEYDHMFLGLDPWIAVVTNVEHDHPDCYPTPQDFYLAFRGFVSRLLPGGALVACGDDPGSARLIKEALEDHRRVLTYGLGEDKYDYRADHMAANARGGFDFNLLRQAGEKSVRLGLQVPGEHNVGNALAALAVADLLGLPLQQAARALGEYRGVGRRFEVRGEVAGVTIVDDYAHHPAEIRATLAAARSRFPGRSIWSVWQPHTYSRTRALFDGFVNAFTEADHVIVLEIFAAREAAPVDGFSASGLVENIMDDGGRHGDDVYFASRLDEAREILSERLAPGDVVLVLSAGDADHLSGQLLQALGERVGGLTNLQEERR